MDRRDISTEFQDLAVERKAGNIDAKSRIKLDSISKAEYNSIIKSLCDLKIDVRGEIVKMNKKVTKMEEIMSDFLKKLNDAFPDASVADHTRCTVMSVQISSFNTVSEIKLTIATSQLSSKAGKMAGME